MHNFPTRTTNNKGYEFREDYELANSNDGMISSKLNVKKFKSQPEILEPQHDLSNLEILDRSKRPILAPKNQILSADLDQSSAADSLNSSIIMFSVDTKQEQSKQQLNHQTNTRSPI